MRELGLESGRIDIGTNAPDFTISDFTIEYRNYSGGQVDHQLLLKKPLPNRTVEPTHPLQNPRHTPFFYSDSLHVFFVTTTEPTVWRFPVYIGYPIYTNLYTTGTVLKLPDLVLKTDPRKEVRPTFRADGVPIELSGLGVIDPAPMERFVTEDAYIRRGIGTTGSVKYGDTQIGPSGAVADARAKMKR